MVLEKRCPKCERAFDIDYLEMCGVEATLGIWSRKCPSCGCYLRLPFVWGITVKVVSLLLAVALACGITTDPAWATVLIALVFSYFISGVLRYVSLKQGNFVHYHS